MSDQLTSVATALSQEDLNERIPRSEEVVGRYTHPRHPSGAVYLRVSPEGAHLVAAGKWVIATTSWTDRRFPTVLAGGYECEADVLLRAHARLDAIARAAGLLAISGASPGERQMTTYFDKIPAAIRAAACGPADELWDRLGEIERQLVTDCTLVAEWPGCPLPTQDAIHAAVLRYAVQCLPAEAPPADFEDNTVYVRRMAMLMAELHGIFHALAEQNLPDFSDDPRQPLLQLYARGDERRGRMVDAPAASSRSSCRSMPNGYSR